MRMCQPGGNRRFSCVIPRFSASPSCFRLQCTELFFRSAFHAGSSSFGPVDATAFCSDLLSVIATMLAGEEVLHGLD